MAKEPRSKSKKPAKTTWMVADNQGRVLLGGRFANQSFIAEELSENEWVLKLARVIPESEAWLYEDAEALAAVRTGLAQARSGKVTKGPNLDGDAKIVGELED